MANSPFKNKYEQMPAYANVKYVELRSLKDGMLRRFIHDGPFPKTPDGRAIKNWQDKNTHSGTSQLLRKIKQREADPIEPDAEIPLFVWDQDGPPPKIWDPKVGDFMSPRVMTPHLKAVMAVFCEQRHEIANEARAALKKKNEAAKAAEQEADERAERAAERAATAMFDRFSEMMSRGDKGKRAQTGGAT